VHGFRQFGQFLDEWKSRRRTAVIGSDVRTLGGSTGIYVGGTTLVVCNLAVVILVAATLLPAFAADFGLLLPTFFLVTAMCLLLRGNGF